MRRVTLELEAEFVPHFRSLVQWRVSNAAEKLGEVAADLAHTGDSDADPSAGELLGTLRELDEVLRGIGWVAKAEEEAAAVTMHDYLAEHILSYAPGYYMRDEIAYCVNNDEPEKAASLAAFNVWLTRRLEELRAEPVPA